MHLLRHAAISLAAAATFLVNLSANAQLNHNQKISFPGDAALSGLPNDARREGGTRLYYLYEDKQVVDVDGDGFLDLVAMDDREAWVVRGNKDTHFNYERRRETSFAEVEGAPFSERKIADVNNDGKADLILVSENNDTVIILPGEIKKNRAFFDVEEKVVMSGLAFSSPTKEFADINNDGFVDYLGIDDGFLVWVPGNEEGRFDESRATFSQFPNADFSFARIVDVNGDGLMDVFRIDGQTASVNIGTSNQGFVESTISATAFFFAAPYIELADFNGDGTQDVLSIFETGEAYVVPSLPDGTLDLAAARHLEPDPIGLSPFSSPVKELVDVNQDGMTDYIGIWPEDGRAVFVPGNLSRLLDVLAATVMVDPIFSAQTTRVLDFNRDGLLDFFGLQGEQAQLLLGMSVGGFDLLDKKTSSSKRFNDANDKRIADINNDGIPDLLLFGDPKQLKNGDVFKCNCNMKSFPGAHLLSASSTIFDAKVPLETPIIARFDTGKILPKNRTCYCAVVTDLNGPWIPSNGRRFRYATSCVGLCGSQCGKNEAGLKGLENPEEVVPEAKTSHRRYPSLIVHDVCQAFIGSVDSMRPRKGSGLTNACGDEGIKGNNAKNHSQDHESHHCESIGLVPAEHMKLIPEDLLPPERFLPALED